MPNGITTTVHDQANEHLDFIEEEYNVTVVVAVAHGSHAWGLSNADSDYDIKAVYVPDSLHQYAQLGSHDETITRDFDEFEIEAWDIQKFGELLVQSNDQALDVLRSPIAYRERFDRDELREFIEENYSPIALYHKYRSISKNNYRKYLSHHLASNRKDTYPILERWDRENLNGYLVRNEHTGKDMFVPDRVIDNDKDEFLHMDFEDVDTTEDDHRYCPNCDRQPDQLPVKFQTTNTRQTVKRNLAVTRASMYAYYVKRTGENGEHELPHVEFPAFLSEQAPDVFNEDVLDLAWELVEKKLDSDKSEIGDRVGHEFAPPPEDIDRDIHVSKPPEKDTLNSFIADILQNAE